MSLKTLTKGMQAMAKGMQAGRMQGRNVMQAGRQAGRQWLRKTPKISDGNFESRPPPPKKKVAFG